MTDRTKHDQKWRQSEKGAATMQRYRTSEKGKTTRDAYRKSDAGRTQQAQERARNKNRPEKQEVLRISHQNWRVSLKRETLVAYSQDPPSCACCGEHIEAFLIIDHVDGGGTRHRAKRSNFYHELRKAGFPKDPPLQVLCCNCNWGRHINGGICPHKTP